MGWKETLTREKAEQGSETVTGWKATLAQEKTEAISGIMQSQPDMVQRLLSDLGGRVSPPPEARGIRPPVISGLPMGVVAQMGQVQNIPESIQKRNAATDTLLKMGYDYQQIKDWASTSRALNPVLEGKVPQMIGSAVGSMALPAAVNLIPGMAALPEEAATIPLGMKVARTITAAIGAGAGGASGKAIQQVLSPYEDVDWGDILGAGIEEGAWELGTRGAALTGKEGIKAGWKLLTRDKPIGEAYDAMRLFAASGGILPPSQVNQSWFHSIMEGVTRSSFGGQQTWDAFDASNRELYDRIGKKIVDSIGGNLIDSDPTEAGRAFVTQISRKGIQIRGATKVAEKLGAGRMLTELHNVTDPLYLEFEKQAKSRLIPDIVSMAEPTGILDGMGRPITRQVKKIVGQKIEGFGISTKPIKDWENTLWAEQKRIKTLDPRVAREVSNLLELPSEITVGEVRKKIASIGAIQAELAFYNKAGKEEMAAMLGQAKDLLFKAPNSPSLPPKLRLRLHNANKIYEAGLNMLDSQDFSFAMAKKLADNPQAAREVLFPKSGRAGSGALQRIQAIKEGLIYDTGELAKLRAGVKGGRKVPSPKGQMAWDMLRKSWLTGELESGSLEKTFEKMGEPALKEILGPDELRVLKTYIDLDKRLGHKNVLGGGSLAIRSGQIRAISQIGGGALLVGYGAFGSEETNMVAIGSGGAIILGPMVYAKLATRGSVGQGLLKQVMQHNLKPTYGSVAPMATRVIRLMIKDDKEQQRKAEMLMRKEQFLKNQPRLMEQTAAAINRGL